MEYRIKRLRPEGIAAALEKADKYRELNHPEEAASIAHDVLAVDADHQLALRMLGLAITDQFRGTTGERFGEARRTFDRLRDPYERAFYTGLACERQAKAQLGAGMPRHSVRALLEEAFARYDEAERLHQPGNDDPVLRWNSCVRLLHTLGEPTPDTEPADDEHADFIPARR